MSKVYGVSRFIMDSGERYCLVVDRSTGLPLYYPNLYLTTQLRNRSVAFATVEAEASHLIVFLRFLDWRQIDLDERLFKGRFFQGHEIDALRDFTQRKPYRNASFNSPVLMFPLGEMKESFEFVSKGTQYSRLTAIAHFFGWYAKHLLNRAGKDVLDQIDRLCRQIKARRPKNKNRADNRRDRSLSDEQLDVLFEVTRPGTDLNPFSPSVQRRNRLIILMLFHLGIRGSELLNIRIRDIRFDKNQLKIERRADDEHDPRTNEPNVKTLERLLPLGGVLVKELHDYISQDRRKVRVPTDRHNDFLFLTHKQGPTKGKPISKSAYFKVMAVVRTVSPDLYAMSGHILRHTWNRKFSERMDAMDESPSEARQEQIRSYLMGWKDGSGTAAIYNRRFVEKKGHEAALKMQNSMGIRMPEGLKNDA
ncbi:site-specific integrase [Halothiobacillus sp.]|uniref:tyrosine-type recombinase/integrase n=1 Tax=Halothiobacillus sp. TaxID=1891311 RepID=UPI00260AF209|nr:site-specific integrase [Halothiobacillus sp.]MDD4965507.1 site-specific integrase [Halothiobacillus sp.]